MGVTENSHKQIVTPFFETQFHPAAGCSVYERESTMQQKHQQLCCSHLCHCLPLSCFFSMCLRSLQCQDCVTLDVVRQNGSLEKPLRER